MTRTYTPDGTPLDILKRQAKRMKTEAGVKLSKAQNQVASTKGYDSWTQLSAALFEVPDDFSYHFTLSRPTGPSGRDRISFSFAGLDDAAAEGLLTEGCELFITRSIEVLGVGRVNYHIDMRMEDDGFIYSHPFTLPRTVSADELIASIASVHTENRPGVFIELVNKMGLLKEGSDTVFDHGEHEAFLEIEMRKLGASVGDRVLFNTPGSKVPSGDPDYDKRCFPNLLTDGRVVVSNGSSYPEELRYAVMPRSEFDAIVDDMKNAFPEGFDKSYDSEHWFFDRVLADRGAEPGLQ